MDINRDNYEEYFLLYADNELTDSEKAEVLMFVKNNKDLEEEFRMVHHTISKPDLHVELTNKSFLFRTTQTSFINKTNYEEVFVLYHDNELSEKQKRETEEFLSRNKELKDEFELIGLARLTPESSVIFSGKKVLYRKEKSGKVIPVMIWRMLAAAVFIGFGLWIISLYFQKPAQENITAAHSIPSKNSSKKIERNILPEKKPAEVVAQSSESSKNSGKEVNEKNEKKQKALYPKNDITIEKNIANTQKSTEENITNQLPEKITNESLVVGDEIKNISKDQISSIHKIDPLKELVQDPVQNNNEKVNSEGYAKNASYVADANNSNQNYVFYDVPTDKFKRTKLGGFLKIAKRVVERNNPITRLLSGEDRQIVSN